MTNMRARFRAYSVAAAIVATLTPSLAQAYNIAAATSAANGPDCAAARPFYWEIGTTSGIVASGQAGGSTYTRNTQMEIASASKWVFGTYVVERNGGSLSNAERRFLNMEGGYNSFNQGACSSSQTVQQCFSATWVDEDGNTVSNSNRTLITVGDFVYGGGDGQKLTIDLGLGSSGNAGLIQAYNSWLSLGPSTDFAVPVPAGGMRSNAADYAEFLKKLIPTNSSGYIMRNKLTEQPVKSLPCPLTNLKCSPLGLVNWRYTLNHWIEDNSSPRNLPNGVELPVGDGTVSSPGAFGFYPWIKRDGASGPWYYGILARRPLNPDGTFVRTAYQDSIPCGIAIRRAFFT